jgi:hypothetical protein
MGEGPLSIMRTLARPRTPSRTTSTGGVLALPDASERKQSQGWRRRMVWSRRLSETL